MKHLTSKLINYLNYIDETDNKGITLSELYGTEYFSTFLYSYCCMVRPKLALELGTGLGATSLMIATALKGNGCGKLLTIDNGNSWDKLKGYATALYDKNAHNISYCQFISHVFEYFEVSDYISFLNIDTKDFKLDFPETIDILFVDAQETDVLGCEKCLKEYLPKMSSFSSMFIDKASTLNHSYLFLKYVVDHLNKNKIPSFLVDGMSDADSMNFEKLVSRCEFDLISLTDHRNSKINKSQNSRAWIKIQPVDFVHHNSVDNFMYW